MTDYKVLPMKVKYTDKIALTKMLLGVYSETVQHLTPRDKDLLTMCILQDINSPDFIDDVLLELNASSRENITTMISRLKKKGLIEKHPVENKKILSPYMKSVQELVKSSTHVGIRLLFDNEG